MENFVIIISAYCGLERYLYSSKKLQIRDIRQYSKFNSEMIENKKRKDYLYVPNQ